MNKEERENIELQIYYLERSLKKLEVVCSNIKAAMNNLIDASSKLKEVSWKSSLPIHLVYIRKLSKINYCLGTLLGELKAVIPEIEEGKRDLEDLLSSGEKDEGGKAGTS